jgi:hypothetical protein
MTGKDLPVTGPLAALCLLAVLVVKLVRDADDDPQAFRLTSLLLAAGSVFYLVPTLLGVQASALGVNDTITQALISHQNQTLALACTYAALLGAGVLLGYAAVYTLRTTSPPATRTTGTAPGVPATPAAG